MRSEPSSIVHRPSSLTSDLRAFLAERLPAYMVPAAFVLLDALPLSANGKIDRKLLPHPDASQTAPVSAYVAPQPGLEQTIATILQEILLLEKIGTHDNFFDLGGNSLHLVQTHSRIQAALGRDIPLVELFNNPTISSLAHYLNQQRAETPQPPDERTDRLKEGKDRLGRLLKRSPR